MENLILSIGKSFGTWTVLETLRKNGRSYFKCVCSCGTVRDVQAKDILTGKSASCGCVGAQKTSQRNRTHGLYKDLRYRSLYVRWGHIKNRCYNRKNPSFPNYGARGIYMSKEWKISFAAFVRDMGQPPFSKAQIDRIDNDGPYCKKNCRWATRNEQQNNKRTNHVMELDGVKHTLSEWAQIAGMQYNSLWTRIVILGWDLHRSLSEPVKPNQIGENHSGVLFTDGQVRDIRNRSVHGESGVSIARSLNVKVGTIYRILQGRTWRHLL